MPEFFQFETVSNAIKKIEYKIENKSEVPVTNIGQKNKAKGNKSIPKNFRLRPIISV
jgi:hypothetical protein